MIFGHSYIRSVALIGLSDFFKGDKDQFEASLQEAALTPSIAINRDSFIPFREFCALAEIVGRKAQLPQLGIEWALAQPSHYPNIGPTMLLSHFSKTVEEWFLAAIKYYKYHSNGFKYALINQPENKYAIGRLTIDPFAFPSRQFIEQSLALCCLCSRVVAKLPDANPVLVKFRHSKPSNTSLHEQVFRCEVQFDADFDEIHLDRDYLQARIDGHLKILKPLMGLYMSHQIEKLEAYDPSASSFVSLAIPNLMGIGRCNIDLVADALNIHVKKLQRSLAEEGVTFSEVYEAVCTSMAKGMLAESHAPIENIARMLDYSTTAPFSLAFKRWTGQSPLQYRKKMAAQKK